jgi:hypothetical protein
MVGTGERTNGTGSHDGGGGRTLGLSAPSHVNIGRRVVVWVEGVSAGDGLNVTLQPTANRGGNGFGAVPKITAYQVGRRIRIAFRWPSFDNHCFGSMSRVGSRGASARMRT